jgi:hypothetical protein
MPDAARLKREQSFIPARQSHTPNGMSKDAALQRYDQSPARALERTLGPQLAEVQVGAVSVLPVHPVHQVLEPAIGLAMAFPHSRQIP